MKKGFLKAIIITVLCLILIPTVAAGAEDNTTHGDWIIASVPTYTVKYGYSMNDAIMESDVITQTNPGQFNSSIDGTKIEGEWELVYDSDKNKLFSETMKLVPAVFTPSDTQKHGEAFELNIANVITVAVDPSFSVVPDVGMQTIGRDVKLSFEISHPKHPEFTSGLPRAFEIKVDVVDASGALIRSLSTETVTGITEYIYTIPDTVSDSEYISFTVTTGEVRSKYNSATKSVTVDVLPKTDVTGKIDFSLDDITYGEAFTPSASFTGSAHGEGCFTYKIAPTGSNAYVELDALLNGSGLLDAGRYNVIATYEDKSQYGQTRALLTVHKRAIVLGVDNLSEISKEYDGSDSLVSAPVITLVELPCGERVSITYSCKLSDKNVGAVNLLVCGVAFDGTTADVDKNYTIEETFEFSGVFITPKTVTVLPDAGQYKAYLDSDPEFTYTVSGLVGEDTLSGSLMRESGEDFGSYSFITSGLTSPNYTVTLDPASPTFEIRGKGLSGAVIVLDNGGSLVYNGKAQTIGVTKITVGTYEITDYEIIGNTATDVGEYTITIRSSTENFIGEATATWRITPKDISNAEITLLDSLVYNGSEQIMRVEVCVDGINVSTFTIEGNTAVNAGTAYKLTVTGVDNFKGTASAFWSITPFNISSATSTDVSLENDVLIYNGAANSPVVKKIFGFDNPTGIISGAGTDVGSHSAVFTGSGNFKGSVRIDYTIAPLDISSATVTLGNALVYNGREQKQTVAYVEIGSLRVTYRTFGNYATDVGSYTLDIEGINNFTGRITREFTVSPLDITGAEIVLGDDLEYNGLLQTQEVISVKKNGLNVTYEISGNTATEIGEYELVITASGNFTGTVTRDWQIYSKTIASAVIELDSSEFIYDGKAHTVTVVSVTIDGNPITYTVSGATATEAGEYTLTVTGTGSYVGTKRLVYRILPRDISDAEVTLGAFPIYDGSDKSAVVESVTLDGYDAVTYTVECDVECAVGIYTVRILGEGNFTGSVTCEWRILPDLAILEGLAVDNVTGESLAALISLKNSISSEVALAEWSEELSFCNSLIEKIGVISGKISYVSDKISGITEDTVSSDDTALLSELSSIIGELLLTSNLSTEERELLSEYSSLVDLLSAKVLEVGMKIDYVREQALKYSSDTVMTADLDALLEISSYLDELLSGANLTDSEREELEAINTDVDAMISLLNEILTKVESVRDTAQELDGTSPGFDALSRVESAISVADELLWSNNLSSEERQIIVGCKNILDALYEKILADAADVAEIIDSLSRYSSDTVKSSDRSDIESIISRIETLLSDSTLSAEKKSKLVGLKSTANALIKVIERVIGDIDNAEYIVNTIESSPITEDVRDAVIEAIEVLESLLAGNNLTDSERSGANVLLARARRILRILDGESLEIDAIIERIYAYYVNSVKSSDRDDITSLKAEAEALLLADELNASHRAILEEGILFISELLKRIDDVTRMLNSANLTEYVGKVNASLIRVGDKVLLLAVKSELSDIILGYEDNLTEGEKEFALSETERINALLLAIDKASFIQERIDALPSADSVEPFDIVATNLLGPLMRDYNSLSADARAVVDTDRMLSLIKAIYVYEILRGDGGIKRVGDGSKLEFDTSAPETLMPSAVKVDGVLIDSTKYIYKGGTLILPESYLDTLELGEHTVSIAYQYGEISASFTIATARPDSDIVVAIIISSIGIVGVAITVFVNRKKLHRHR